MPDEAAAIHAGGRKPVKLAPLERIRSRYYLRLEVRDQPGVLAQVATVMARNRVSIESVIQRGSRLPAAAMLILTTHESNEQAIGATLAGLAAARAACSRRRCCCASGTSRSEPPAAPPPLRHSRLDCRPLPLD